jgi:hypothetical protein
MSNYWLHATSELPADVANVVAQFHDVIGEPSEALKPSLARYTLGDKARMLRDLWSSYEGLNQVATDLWVTDITTLGGYLNTLFPTYRQELAQQKGLMFKGDLVTLTEFIYEAERMEEISVRHMPRLLTNKRSSRTQSLRMFGAGFAVPMDFPLDPIKTADFRAKCAQASEGIVQTLSHMTVETLVAQGMQFHHKDISDKLPLPESQFESFILGRNDQALAFIKGGVGADGVENIAWVNLQERGAAVPNTMMVGRGAILRIKFTREVQRTYDKTGLTGYLGPDKDLDTQMTMKTKNRGLELCETRAYKAPGDNISIDPLVRTMVISERMFMPGKPINGQLDENYRSTFRSIKIVNGQTCDWFYLKLEDALEYSLIFDTASSNLSAIGGKLLTIIARGIVGGSRRAIQSGADSSDSEDENDYNVSNRLGFSARAQPDVNFGRVAAGSKRGRHIIQGDDDILDKVGAGGSVLDLPAKVNLLNMYKSAGIKNEVIRIIQARAKRDPSILNRLNSFAEKSNRSSGVSTNGAKKSRFHVGSAGVAASRSILMDPEQFENENTFGADVAPLSRRNGASKTAKGKKNDKGDLKIGFPVVGILPPETISVYVQTSGANDDIEKKWFVADAKHQESLPLAYNVISTLALRIRDDADAQSIKKAVASVNTLDIFIGDNLASNVTASALVLAVYTKLAAGVIEPDWLIQIAQRLSDLPFGNQNEIDLVSRIARVVGTLSTGLSKKDAVKALNDLFYEAANVEESSDEFDVNQPALFRLLKKLGGVKNDVNNITKGVNIRQQLEIRANGEHRKIAKYSNTVGVLEDIFVEAMKLSTKPTEQVALVRAAAWEWFQSENQEAAFDVLFPQPRDTPTTLLGDIVQRIVAKGFECELADVVDVKKLRRLVGDDSPLGDALGLKVEEFRAGSGSGRSTQVVSSITGADYNDIKSALKQIKPLKEVLVWAINNDIPLPFSFIPFRMYIQIAAACALFFKRGEETAMMVIREADVSFAIDIPTQTVTVPLRFSAGLFVRKQGNIEYVPNVFPVNYIGGAGVTFFGTQHRVPYSAGQIPADIFICVDHYSFNLYDRFYTDITGYMDHRVYTGRFTKDNGTPMYNTADIYSEFWNWKQWSGGHMFSSAHQININPQNCTLSLQTSQYCYLQSTDGTSGGYTHFIPGKTALGQKYQPEDFNFIRGVRDFGGEGLEGAMQRHA